MDSFFASYHVVTNSFVLCILPRSNEFIRSLHLSNSTASVHQLTFWRHASPRIMNSATRLRLQRVLGSAMKVKTMTDLRGNVFFDGPEGRIEAIIKEPDSPVIRAAIVCHPHPLYGGTMHNKVVFRIARAFQDGRF